MKKEQFQKFMDAPVKNPRCLKKTKEAQTADEG
jgi:hypothetical protein